MAHIQSLTDDFGISGLNHFDGNYSFYGTNPEYHSRKRRAYSAVYRYLQVLQDDIIKSPPSVEKELLLARSKSTSEVIAMFFASKKVLSELKNVEFEDNQQRQQIERMKHQNNQGSDPFYVNDMDPNNSYYGQRKLPTAAKMKILDYWEPPSRKTVTDVFKDYALRFEKPNFRGVIEVELPYTHERFKKDILRTNRKPSYYFENEQDLTRFLETVTSYLQPSGHFEEDFDTPAYRARYPERFVTNI